MSLKDSVVLPALKPSMVFSVVHKLPSLTSPSLVLALAAEAKAALRSWQRSASEAAFPFKGDSFNQPSRKGTLQAHPPPQVATMCKPLLPLLLLSA